MMNSENINYDNIGDSEEGNETDIIMNKIHIIEKYGNKKIYNIIIWNLLLDRNFT